MLTCHLHKLLTYSITADKMRVSTLQALYFLIFIILHELQSAIWARQVQKDQQRATSEGFTESLSNRGTQKVMPQVDFRTCLSVYVWKKQESGKRVISIIVVIMEAKRDLYFSNTNVAQSTALESPRAFGLQG